MASTLRPVSPALPAVPVTTPAWLVRLVSILLVLCGPALDYFNPSGKLNTAAAQAAVIVAFVLVAGVIFVVHSALAAIHAYGWSKSAAAVFLDSSGVELRSLITEAKPLVEQAKPALDAVGPLSSIVNRLGELEHRVSQQTSPADRAVLEVAVRSILGPLAAALPSAAAVTPAVPVAAPVAPAEPVSEPSAPGAPVTTALQGSAPA